MPLIYENKKAKLLNILRIGINPFKKFVATGEIKEELGFVPSRQDFMESINDIIDKNENFILPIVGKIGTGKSHLYWALKYKLYYHNIIYISLENVYRKFFYNLYSEYIEEMGVEPLRSITNKLCNDWGALEKKFGFFHIIDIEKIRTNAFKQLSDKFEDQIALMDTINAITAHQLDPYKRLEAENWLLGELMDIRDLSRLNLMHDLRGKHNAYTMLKILVENSKLGSLFFIDDFEKIISIMKQEEQTEEIYDPSYLYGETETPEKIAAQKVLDKILKLLKIRGLKIIVTLKSPEALEEIKNMIKGEYRNLLITIKEPMFLPEFTENDIHQFYKESMENFLKYINYLEYLEDYPNLYFPLSEIILRYIYTRTQGNPREIIKYLIKIFNEIIYSDEKLEDIIKNYEKFC